ncbi:hypothetical protein CL52_19570 [Stutzerimonas balearica DSM 6083]|uniref:Uncharacterized protein n=1 Tax=Stutzerimonas balearica DSM 6083 TaxID=1123016 RepID=A0A8D3Y568_9GAMM|nr:hypothetical protein CL52_19570 [Stutzerimonas balearica DSM 6083]
MNGFAGRSRAVQIVGRISIDKSLLYGHTQDTGDVLTESAGRFQGIATLSYLKWRHQVPRFQFRDRARSESGEQVLLHPT